jgi:hypothetical protein
MGNPAVTPGTLLGARAIELVAVDHDAARAVDLIDCGVSTFLVDWECRGKDARQQGFDTEIKPGTVTDLAAVAAVPGAVAWCRVNGIGPHTRTEVDAAIAAGARGLFLPMVTGPADVDCFLGLIAGRAAAGILVETADALARVGELRAFPLERVYFGLNDFAISRGGGSIFRALLDGSVARAREAFEGTSFGFGGLTAPASGHPVICRRLIEEMARLRCDFSFLRRSFRRDQAMWPARAIVEDIQSAWAACARRESAAIARDHARLCSVLRELPRPSP